jgi:hypothetical protein
MSVENVAGFALQLLNFARHDQTSSRDLFAETGKYHPQPVGRNLNYEIKKISLPSDSVDDDG